MRLTEEQALQDDKRYASCNMLAELKYCGWDIPHRKSITNDEIHFYAWLCRSAVSMLKEQEAVEPYVTGRGETFETAETWWYACGNCHEALDVNDKYCRHCGRSVKWE